MGIGISFSYLPFYVIQLRLQVNDDNSQIFTIFNIGNYIHIQHKTGLTKLINLGVKHIHIDFFWCYR